jgi:hypothetical protein
VDTATLRNAECSTPNHLVLRCSWIVVSASPALFLVSLSQGRKALLLCYRVDVRADGESHHVEERDPSMFGKELLRKGKSKGGYDPADLHDRHETGLPCRMDLVECSRTSDDGH